MARWATQVPTWTTAAIADTTALTDGNHHTIRGGTATQRGELRRVYVSGQAAASAPQIMVMGRTATAGTTLTTCRMAAIDPATADLSANASCYTAASTDPGRSATLGMLLALGFNAYGGIVNWQNGQDEIVGYLGSVVNFGELSINCFTGTTAAAVQSEIVFEVL